MASVGDKAPDTMGLEDFGFMLQDPVGQFYASEDVLEVLVLLLHLIGIPQVNKSGSGSTLLDTFQFFLHSSSAILYIMTSTLMSSWQA